MKYNSRNFAFSEKCTLLSKDIEAIKLSVEELSLINNVRCIILDVYPDINKSKISKGIIVPNIFLKVVVDDELALRLSKEILDSLSKTYDINYEIITIQSIVFSVDAKSSLMRDISNGYTLLDRDDYSEYYLMSRLSQCHLSVENIDDLEKNITLKNTKSS